MCLFLKKYFNKSEYEAEIKVRNTSKCLKEMIDSDLFVNVFEKYSHDKQILDYLSFFEFTYDCGITMEELINIPNIEVFDQLTLIRGFKITLYTAQYKELQAKTSESESKKLLVEIRKYFNNMSYIDKVEFSYAFLETLTKLNEFIKSLQYNINKEDSKILNEALTLIRNHNKGLLKDDTSLLRDEVKMEIEYLKKISAIN